MSKPIAVIHWINAQGAEQFVEVHDMVELQEKMDWIKSKNYVSWTCMLSGKACVPRMTA